jgi:hypothetical protein
VRGARRDRSARSNEEREENKEAEEREENRTRTRREHEKAASSPEKTASDLRKVAGRDDRI